MEPRCIRPSQARVLRDLVACRTAAGGEQLTKCTACDRLVYRYHSCRNRHCPKCGGDQTARWLERHRPRALALPALPDHRDAPTRTARAGLCAASPSSTARSCAAPPPPCSNSRPTRAISARGGVRGCPPYLDAYLALPLGRPLDRHRGGLSADRTRWIRPKNPAFLLPVRALSLIVRAKMCAALNQAGGLGRSRPPSGPGPGWCMPSPPAPVSGCLSTSRGICFGSRSATAASNSSTISTWSFAIATTARRRSAALLSPASNFSAASCCTSYRNASSASATSASSPHAGGRRSSRSVVRPWSSHRPHRPEPPPPARPRSLWPCPRCGGSHASHRAPHHATTRTRRAARGHPA
jgi:predicted RNA-binding Zn-ribbon protein involved in translation (DUF1610 family)